MKKTLLIAAAALAAGVISSQAQVYSQNVVGYANVPTPTAFAQYLISVPFKIGVSNGANEVFPPGSIPDFSQILIWDTGSSSFGIYNADSTSPTGWSDAGFTPVNPPLLPVGQGFFMSPSDANTTNVFAGTIAVNVGSSNVMTLPTAFAQYLVGCVVPYGGSVTNAAGVNLTGLPDFSQILVWDTASNGYNIYNFDSTSPTGWSDAGFTPVTPPSISVGQGMFISPSDNNATWTNSLAF